MIKIQITLFNEEGRYKPVSTLVDVESVEYYKAHAQEVKTKGIVKICQKRLWGRNDLKRFGYTLCKVRVYDKTKIEQENRERYEKIKEERGWK